MLMPGLSREAAQREAENVRRLIEELGLPHQSSRVGPVVTVSTRPIAAGSGGPLLERRDALLQPRECIHPSREIPDRGRVLLNLGAQIVNLGADLLDAHPKLAEAQLERLIPGPRLPVDPLDGSFDQRESPVEHFLANRDPRLERVESAFKPIEPAL